MPKKKENTAWKWIQGTVDPKKAHMEIFYADDSKPVALVAPAPNCSFTVQFTRHRRLQREAQAAVRQELNFYLVKLKEKDPWAYAIYHCSTAANIYSSVHWAYIPDKG